MIVASVETEAEVILNHALSVRGECRKSATGDKMTCIDLGRRHRDGSECGRS